MMGRGPIVTNGDQTDTIRDFLEKGLPFEQALRTREFEPDGPNWTPRISGLLSPDGSYKLSILKAADDGRYRLPAPDFFEYPAASRAWAISSTPTSAMGTPSPPMRGSPPPSLSKGDIDAFTASLWENLNQDNKVSLFVRYHRPGHRRHRDPHRQQESVNLERMDGTWQTNWPLKYGCNPNQKPSRIFMKDGSELPVTVL